MKIGISYDGVFSTDEDTFGEIIAVAKKHGHDVAVVTSRSVKFSKIENIRKKYGVEVIYTAGYAKARFFKADVWIDDRPQSVYNDLYGGKQ